MKTKKFLFIGLKDVLDYLVQTYIVVTLYFLLPYPMSKATTITVRTKKSVKEEAQKFFDGLGISLSAGVNMFLNHVASNHSIAFYVQNKEPSVSLYSMENESLSDEQKKAYDRVKQLPEEAFTYITAEGYED